MNQRISVYYSEIWWNGDFPDGPVVKACTSSAGGMDSIPGRGTKIPQAPTVWPKKKKLIRKRKEIQRKQLKLLKVTAYEQ